MEIVNITSLISVSLKFHPLCLIQFTVNLLLGLRDIFIITIIININPCIVVLSGKSLFLQTTPLPRAAPNAAIDTVPKGA